MLPERESCYRLAGVVINSSTSLARTTVQTARRANTTRRPRRLRAGNVEARPLAPRVGKRLALPAPLGGSIRIAAGHRVTSARRVEAAVIEMHVVRQLREAASTAVQASLRQLSTSGIQAARTVPSVDTHRSQR